MNLNDVLKPVDATERVADDEGAPQDENFEGELLTIKIKPGGNTGRVYINDKLVYSVQDDDPEMVGANVSMFISELMDDLQRAGYLLGGSN